MVGRDVDNEVSKAEQERRIAWFHEYVARTEAGPRAEGGEGQRFACPCCGYPTLDSRGLYDICRICWWEDDGQDDPRADEVWGGPNHQYSLTMARENFARYLVMYPPDTDPRLGSPENATQMNAKRSMIRAFEAMREASTEDQESLWSEVTAAEAILDSELRRRAGGA